MKKIVEVLIVIIAVIAVVSGVYFLWPKGYSPENINQDASAAKEEKVSIKGFLFNPQVLIIDRGTKITWTNEDVVPHTATSQGVFDSGSLSQGESFSFVFNEAGAFEYMCVFHPNMKGEIIVE